MSPVIAGVSSEVTSVTAGVSTSVTAGVSTSATAGVSSEVTSVTAGVSTSATALDYTTCGSLGLIGSNLDLISDRIIL